MKQMNWTVAVASLLIYPACSAGSANTTNSDAVTADAGLADNSTTSSTDAATKTDASANYQVDGSLPTTDGAAPTSCQTDSNCLVAGACPSDATKGCGCAQTPSGLKCVPKCSSDSDCPNASQTCGSAGVCVPGSDAGTPLNDRDGAPPNGDGGGGGGGGGPAMNTANTISDNAQAMTIAFDGLAFVTGSFCAQTFYPPGKVADFFGFQYLRDNDPTNMGHNVEFTTLTANPVLTILTDAQLQMLAAIGKEDAG
ncbi:MAG: hypothetical protein WCI05_15285 [Myxococcales bacterium]